MIMRSCFFGSKQIVPIISHFVICVLSVLLLFLDDFPLTSEFRPYSKEDALNCDNCFLVGIAMSSKKYGADDATRTRSILLGKEVH